MIKVSVLLLVASLLGPSTATSASEPQVVPSAERILHRVVATACAERDVDSTCRVLQVSKQELRHGIVYYRALIQVGEGDFDIIAVNRVIREARHGVAARTVGSFFFIHGSAGDFRGVMVTPREGGLGLFLAQHNLDVWGIDLRNVQIPVGTTDFSFARNWGFDVQIRDVMLGTRIARRVRALTRQDPGGLVLAGFSSGAALAYSVANAEARLSPADRDVAGLVPIDMVFKLPPLATPQGELSCNLEAQYRAINDGGQAIFDNLSIIALMQLAQTDPDETSPDGAPLTNLQRALEFAGTSFFWPVYPYHPFGVRRDDSGVAVDRFFTPVDEILKTLAATTPYSIPNATFADIFATSCPTADSSYDDNLIDVEVPVLYIGSAGGFGQTGAYTTQLLGSTDVTTVMIQLQPDDAAQADFGHMEFFTAEDARSLAWEPIRAWIVKRFR